MVEEEKAGLYRVKNSNRDFSKKEDWGKNKFNNAFPIALACYMHDKKLNPTYLTLNEKLSVHQTEISVKDLFNVNPTEDGVSYQFETKFKPYESLDVKDKLNGNDVVIRKDKEDLTSLEIKLTTLPDNQTSNLDEEKYGSEIVVRPVTIIYQAYSIASSFLNDRNELFKILNPVYSKVTNWGDENEVYKCLEDIKKALNFIFSNYHSRQKPLMLHAIWKTVGQSFTLADQCLDIFVWSDFSLSKLYMENKLSEHRKITRFGRTMVWLFLMLYQFSQSGKIDHKGVLETCVYGPKNDKSFSAQGIQTNKLMSCANLKNPRVKKTEIKKIILGQGETLLSPERRFDTAIMFNMELFD